MKKKTKAQVRKEYATLEEKDADYLKSLGMDQKSALLGVMRGFRDKGMDSSKLEANQDDDSSDDGSAVPTEVDVESADVRGSCRFIGEEEDMEATNRWTAFDIHGAHVKQPSESNRVYSGGGKGHGEDV